MDTKSVITTDRLYWLGRYTARVYTTLKMFEVSFDKLIEADNREYAEFCNQLEIPNIYKDKDDFIARYAFDQEDPNSILSNLMRAYDNAIELREEIGSESLAYIQLSVYSIQKAKASNAPFLELQNVMDDILAFWGIVDDQIDDKTTRNIIKVGKRIERVDLYARVRTNDEALRREMSRLVPRLKESGLKYSEEKLEHLIKLCDADKLDYHQIVNEIESLTEV